MGHYRGIGGTQWDNILILACYGGGIKTRKNERVGVV